MFAISIQISSSQKQNEGSNPPMIPYTCYIVLSLIKLINTGIWKTPGQLNVPASIHPYSQVWSRETVDSVGPQWVQQTVRRATESKIIWKKPRAKKDIGDESKASAKNRFLSTDLQHFPTYGKRFNLALFVKFDSSWVNTKKNWTVCALTIINNNNNNTHTHHIYFYITYRQN